MAKIQMETHSMVVARKDSIFREILWPSFEKIKEILALGGLEFLQFDVAQGIFKKFPQTNFSYAISPDLSPGKSELDIWWIIALL